jgi:hypothetical protein
MADEKKIKEQIKDKREEVLAKSRLWTKKTPKMWCLCRYYYGYNVTMSLELCSMYICN